MNDWKVWFKLFIISLFINLCLVSGLVIGYTYTRSQTARSTAEHTAAIAELEKRNGELSAGLDLARADADRNLQLFVGLRASIKSVTDRSRTSIEDARRIKDTARRVDAIAGALVTAIDEIIKANYLLEDSCFDSRGSSWY